MNEITTNKRVVSIIPGLDKASGDLKAYSLQNTIIAGKAGSGVYTLVNGIIKNLVENYSPNSVGIELYVRNDAAPWLMENRQLPHFSTQVYGTMGIEDKDNANYIKAFTRLYELYIIALQRKKCYNQKHDRKYVIFFELCYDMFKESDHLKILKDLMSICEDAGIYIYLINQDSVNLKELDLIDLCDLRLVTRVSESVSNELLNCNIATRSEDLAGFVWVLEADNPYVLRRLDVPFYPDTMLRKLCKVMSNKRVLADASFVTFEEKIRESVEEYNNRKDMIADLFNPAIKERFVLQSYERMLTGDGEHK